MHEEILRSLPYLSSFRFVDGLSSLDEDGVTGYYTLKPGSFFYEDHFVGNPVTPGVILIEIMAQIGLVVLGIYLVRSQNKAGSLQQTDTFPLLTSSEVEFFKMVKPGEKVTVHSKKQYFRFGKLKCYIEMVDDSNELIARGMIAGVLKKSEKE